MSSVLLMYYTGDVMDRDQKLNAFYRWLVNTQGIDQELPQMQEFKRLVDNDSTEILARVRRIKPVSDLAGLYKIG